MITIPNFLMEHAITWSSINKMVIPERVFEQSDLVQDVNDDFNFPVK